MSELLPNAYAICGGLVQKHDADRYVATLFAPADRRPYLHALQAFSLEIAGVRAAAKEPMPGEVRLQWWRDVLNGQREEEANGHPVGMAIRDTIAVNKLPAQALLDLIDARAFDLYDEPPADWNALEGYCGETSSALFRLASIVLMKGEEPGSADAAGHAGVAYAMAGLLRAFPWHSRRGQVFLPQSVLTAVGLDREDIVSGSDTPKLRAALSEMRTRAYNHLAKARALKGGIRPEIKTAFLPLAMVERYLSPMDGRTYKPFATVIDVANWLRVWTMWRWSRSQ
jgi:15-cis-phytoene synthase